MGEKTPCQLPKTDNTILKYKHKLNCTKFIQKQQIPPKIKKTS